MDGRSVTGICFVCMNALEGRGTIDPVSYKIRSTSSVYPSSTIMVITSTGPLLGKGKGSVDLML